MPTGACHSFFWKSRGAGAPLLGASARNGYVPWMTTVTIGSGFGVTQVVWEWLTKTATTTWQPPKK